MMSTDDAAIIHLFMGNNNLRLIDINFYLQLQLQPPPPPSKQQPFVFACP